MKYPSVGHAGLVEGTTELVEADALVLSCDVSVRLALVVGDTDAEFVLLLEAAWEETVLSEALDELATVVDNKELLDGDTLVLVSDVSIGLAVVVGEVAGEVVMLLEPSSVEEMSATALDELVAAVDGSSLLLLGSDALLVVSDVSIGLAVVVSDSDSEVVLLLEGSSGEEMVVTALDELATVVVSNELLG